MRDSSYRSLPGPQTITHRRLSNGLQVLVYPTPHTRSVVITGTLHAGALNETPALNGLAALTAESLLLGTRTRDFATLHGQLEDIGADLEFTGGYHKAGFSGQALAEDLPVLLDLLQDGLCHPVFPVDEVQRKLGETLTWQHYREQDTQWQAGRMFRRHLYPVEHPYHRPAAGTTDTLPRLTSDAMRQFHAQHYRPDGMILVIVGAVDPGEALAGVAQRFETWSASGGEPPPLPVVHAPSSTRQTYTGIPGKTQADIVLGTLGPSRRNSDYRAASLLNSILGEFAMMGRIGESVRERAGLAYYASSSLSGGYGPGPWRVFAGVDPEHIPAALDLIDAELRRIVREPVSGDDLADNVAYFTGRLPLQLERNEGLASVLLTIANFDLGLDYLHRYPDLIAALTPDDLLQAARRYWNPDALVIAVAGPEDA